jgi:hypothetical protein
MSYLFESLPRLADRLRRGDPEAPRLRQEIEESLGLLIRSAIRSGAGRRELVDWVHRHLPPVPDGTSPESAAPSLARLLCDTLLRPHLCQATCETVRAW